VSTPAVEIRSFAVTIPAATLETAPYTEDIYFPARIVNGVTWQVPPGPSGLMGWRLTMSGGNAVIPTGGGWIIADDARDTWLLQDQPDSGAWELTGYNTDIYDHTVYLDFLLDLVTVPTTTPGQIPNSALSSVTTPVSTTTATVPVPAATTPVSIPGVSVPVSIPAVSVPAPVSIPAVSVPQPVSIPPVSVPAPVSVPLPKQPVPVPKPGPPLHPSVSDITADGATLHWDAPANATAAGVLLYNWTVYHASTIIKAGRAVRGPYTVTGLARNTTYDFGVSASGAEGSGPASSRVTWRTKA